MHQAPAYQLNLAVLLGPTQSVVLSVTSLTFIACAAISVRVFTIVAKPVRKLIGQGTRKSAIPKR